MKQGRAKGVTHLPCAGGAAFVVFELDENGKEINRILVTLTELDIPELVGAYAGLKGKSFHETY